MIFFIKLSPLKFIHKQIPYKKERPFRSLKKWVDSNTITDTDGPLYEASACVKQAILDYHLNACLPQVGL